MKKLLLMLAATFFFTGCSIQNIYMTEDSTPAVAQEGDATITFYRLDTFFGQSIPAVVAEQIGNTGTVDNVGVFARNDKLTLVVKPGEHTFVVLSEAWQGFKCTVEANKHYYVKICPKKGIAWHRFAFEPLTKDQLATARYKTEISAANFVKLNSKGDKYFADSYPFVLDQLYTAVSKNEFVYLNKEDGLDEPL